MNDGIVIINSDVCTGCGKCVALCPRKILFIDTLTGKCGVTDGAKCDRLRGCERICPVRAIIVR